MTDVYLVFKLLGLGLLVSTVLRFFAPSIQRAIDTCLNGRERQKSLQLLAEQYETFRKSREDLLFHVDWAKSRGDHKEAADISERISVLEANMNKLRALYDRINLDSKFVKLSSFESTQTNGSTANSLEDSVRLNKTDKSTKFE